MKTYTQTFKINNSHIDENNHVNNVVFVQWTNDIALAHWKHNASQQILESYFWVLTNHNITYKRQAFLGDTIKIETKIIESDGVRCKRQVRFYNTETEKLLAESITTWCFMNTESKRPTRITEEIEVLFM